MCCILLSLGKKIKSEAIFTLIFLINVVSVKSRVWSAEEVTGKWLKFVKTGQSWIKLASAGFRVGSEPDDVGNNIKIAWSPVKNAG